MTDPLYGPNAQHPTDDDELSYPLGLSEAVIERRIEELAAQRKHDTQHHRAETRAPKDRMLKLPRRNR